VLQPLLSEQRRSSFNNSLIDHATQLALITASTSRHAYLLSASRPHLRSKHTDAPAPGRRV
jgi:hypothetical protein